MIAEAASLGLDSQVRSLLHGDPLQRSIARIVVRAARRKVDLRARTAAYYFAALNNGVRIKD